MTDRNAATYDRYHAEPDVDVDWYVGARVAYPGKGPGTIEAIASTGGLLVAFDSGERANLDPDGAVHSIEEDPPGFNPATDGP